MRKVILQEFVTIDSFAATLNGKMDYAARNDKKFQEDAERFLDAIDTMILGANTYSIFVQYWPGATEEGTFAKKLNSLSKYVVSTSLKSAPWGNWEGAEVIGNNLTEKITALKQKSGKDIVVWGSISLAQLLMKERLIDEIQLRVCPAVLGEGQRLFAQEVPMKLLEAKTYDKGMVLLRYDPT